MREVLLLTSLIMCFGSQAWAQPLGAKPEARIVFAGEVGKAGSRDIQARPGVRFGLELVFEGAPKGTSVVLEAKLLRPKDPEGLPPIRWLVAAKAGAPAQIAWEFAYDWEVEPGVWTMKVFFDERELASVPFTVVRAVSPAQASKSLDSREGRPAKSGDTSGLPQNRNEGAKNESGDSGAKVRGQKNLSDAAQSSGKSNGAVSGQNQENIPVGSSLMPATASTGTAQVDPGIEGAHDRKRSGQVKTSTQSPTNAQRVVGGKPERRVYALMGGAYSEEARALRVASGLKVRGVVPCLRVDFKNGKKLWHVVAGWKDSPEAARKAKAELLPVLGEVFVQPMSARELETGLTCR